MGNLRKICEISIIKQQTDILYVILSEIIDVSKCLKREDGVIFDNFAELFYNCSLLSLQYKQPELFVMVCRNMFSYIQELESSKLLIKSMMKKCIGFFPHLLRNAILFNQTEAGLEVTRTIERLLNDINFINNDVDFYEQIIDALYLGGVESIEQSNDVLLKDISNKLGWIGFNAIKSKKLHIYEKIINVAVKIFMLALELRTNEKALIFLSTLYLILGSYLKYTRNFSYLNEITKIITGNNIFEYFEKGKKLRYHESTIWDDKFEGKAKKYFNDFYNDVSKFIEKRDSLKTS
jgi:hypothetical protein